MRAPFRRDIERIDPELREPLAPPDGKKKEPWGRGDDDEPGPGGRRRPGDEDDGPDGGDDGPRRARELLDGGRGGRDDRGRGRDDRDVREEIERLGRMYREQRERNDDLSREIRHNEMRAQDLEREKEQAQQDNAERLVAQHRDDHLSNQGRIAQVETRARQQMREVQEGAETELHNLRQTSDREIANLRREVVVATRPQPQLTDPAYDLRAMPLSARQPLGYQLRHTGRAAEVLAAPGISRGDQAIMRQYTRPSYAALQGDMPRLVEEPYMREKMRGSPIRPEEERAMMDIFRDDRASPPTKATLQSIKDLSAARIRGGFTLTFQE